MGMRTSEVGKQQTLLKAAGKSGPGKKEKRNLPSAEPRTKDDLSFEKEE